MMDLFQKLIQIRQAAQRAEVSSKVNTALYEQALDNYSELAFSPNAVPEALATAREEIHVALDRVLDDAGVLPRLLKEAGAMAAQLRAQGADPD